MTSSSIRSSSAFPFLSPMNSDLSLDFPPVPSRREWVSPYSWQQNTHLSDPTDRLCNDSYQRVIGKKGSELASSNAAAAGISSSSTQSQKFNRRVAPFLEEMSNENDREDEEMAFQSSGSPTPLQTSPTESGADFLDPFSESIGLIPKREREEDLEMMPALQNPLLPLETELPLAAHLDRQSTPGGLDYACKKCEKLQAKQSSSSLSAETVVLCTHCARRAIAAAANPGKKCGTCKQLQVAGVMWHKNPNTGIGDFCQRCYNIYKKSVFLSIEKTCSACKTLKKSIKWYRDDVCLGCYMDALKARRIRQKERSTLRIQNSATSSASAATSVPPPASKEISRKRKDLSSETNKSKKTEGESEKAESSSKKSRFSNEEIPVLPPSSTKKRTSVCRQIGKEPASKVKGEVEMSEADALVLASSARKAKRAASSILKKKKCGSCKELVILSQMKRRNSVAKVVDVCKKCYETNRRKAALLVERFCSGCKTNRRVSKWHKNPVTNKLDICISCYYNNWLSKKRAQ